MSQLTDTTLFESAKVDREGCVVRGVKILGRESRNGRTYSDAALKQAAGLYEGVGVNIDHPDRDKPGADRRFADGFGYLQAVQVKADGVYGDLVYLKSHRLAEQVVEAAERMPGQLGLSHNAEGRVANRSGRQIVEEITSVRSVDLVRNPATVRGLFESEKMSARINVGRNKKIQLIEMEDGSVATEAAPEVMAEPAQEDAVLASILQKVTEIFKDPNIDPKETGRRITDLAKWLEKFNEEMGNKADPAAEPAADAPADGAEPMPESVRVMQTSVNSLIESVRVMKHGQTLRDVLDEFGLRRADLTAERLRLVESQKDAAAMRTLIESWPAYQRQPAGNGQRRPITESTTGPVKPKGASWRDHVNN